MAIQQPKQDLKLTQFLEEVNKLQETYQYSLKATLNVTDAGVVPVLSVVNIIPAKSVKKEAKPVSKKKEKK